MSTFTRNVLLVGAVVCLIQAPVALAQYPSELVGFNGPPIDDPVTAQEMFRIPQWSGSTRTYVVPNTPGFYDFNAAYRAAGLHTEGAAAMYVFFDWVDANDPDAWLRLTTFDGPERPNPSLHTEGKVRFKLTNRSELFNGEIGVCLGIRETDVEVPQMYDGGTDGTIEWVGVDTTPNGITAGADGIVDTTANPMSDDVQVYPVGYDIVNDPNEPLPTGTAVIEPGPDGVLQTTPTPDDQVRFGYFIAANGTRRPLPAITLPPNSNEYVLEWNLVTGAVSIGGVGQGGGVAGFTGDGDLSTPNSRGTLESIVFTNLPDDPAVFIEMGIDELQFEAPVPDPVLPPTVVWPIIAGDETVTVTDLQNGVSMVLLYLGGSLHLAQPVTTTDDVVFTLPDPAETDQVYTATQIVNGTESAHSAPVTVLPEPPPHSFSLLVDEGGTGSCDYTTGGWEWVGATSVTQVGSYWGPDGQLLFPDDAVWQTVDIPLDDDSLVIASLGGNGELGPSPTGFYTIDSLWFTASAPEVTGPWEVFVDAVELIDPNGQVSETILDMEDGVNHLPLRRGQSQDVTTSSGLSSVASFDGTWSHRLLWTYDGVEPESLGMLQRVGTSCATSELIDDTSLAIRFHLLCRGQPTNPDVPLPEIVGPIVVGNQDTIRVFHETQATTVDLYINGELTATLPNAGGSETDFPSLTLQPGDSISAKQTLSVGGESDFAYPRGISDQPPPPVVGEPLLPGATSVTVVSVAAAPFATASAVNVYVNGSPAGSAPGGSETVEVPTIELQPGDLVTATQTVNGVVSDLSAEAVVGDTTVLREYEFSLTLAELSRSISADDLINAQIGALETGDVDPNNGVSAWNMDSGSGCLEMMYTMPSPGFHGATPGGAEGGLIDLTDGLEGSTIEAVLADYARAALVVRYDFDRPVNIRELVVFAANEDPGAPNNGRIFQHYDAWVSTDDMQSFQPLVLTVTTGGFGYLNVNDLRASWTRVYDGLSFFLVKDVTNLRLVFYDVSNTGHRFVDPWQGNFNEDLAYQTLCPDTEPEDTDGYRKAFEAPIIKEIDVFGYYPGDLDGDGDVDLSDLAQLLGHYGTTSGATYTDGDFDGDGDVDLSDLAELLGHYGEGT